MKESMQAVGCGSVNVPPFQTPPPHRSLHMNNTILAIDLGKYKCVALPVRRHKEVSEARRSNILRKEEGTKRS